MGEVQDLEAFGAIAEKGGFAAAGRVLGRSTPTITRSVQRLEAALGLMLFEGAGRAKKLNSAGERLRDLLRPAGVASASAVAAVAAMTPEEIACRLADEAQPGPPFEDAESAAHQSETPDASPVSPGERNVSLQENAKSAPPLRAETMASPVPLDVAAQDEVDGTAETAMPQTDNEQPPIAPACPTPAASFQDAVADEGAEPAARVDVVPAEASEQLGRRGPDEAAAAALRVALPEHPVISARVRDELLRLGSSASFEFVPGILWTGVVEALLTGRIDLGFSWSPDGVDKHYPPEVLARRLRRDDFAFLLVSKTVSHSFGDIEGSSAHLWNLEVALPLVVGQRGLEEVLWPPLEKAQARRAQDGTVPARGGLLTPLLAQNTPAGLELVPLIAFAQTRAGVDAVYRASLAASTLPDILKAAERAFAWTGEVGPVRKPMKPSLWQRVREFWSL
jgi:DNA-binding transcriptional LysR family regulator